MTVVVSIVSGKGGSGKSLLTAVIGRALAREGQRVLLADLDIFVRGLTVLLFSFRRPERRDGAITMSDLLGIFSQDSDQRAPEKTDKSNYMIQRFLECDVLPAVDNISAPLDYDDKNIGNESYCDACVRAFLSSVQSEYDYIFLDNRAGMDSLVAAACRNANIVLAVAEDDPVGRQTNTNLVRFLQTRGHARAIYSVVNKGRNIHSYADIKDRSKHRDEFSMLGIIPFDLDILDEFGSDRFWTTITETLYFRAVLDTWNGLSSFEDVIELSVSKYKFPPGIFMQRSQGRYTLFERVLRLYSIVFILAGAAIWLYGQVRYQELNIFQVSAVASIIFGGVALAFSTSGIQSFFRGHARDRYEKKKNGA